MAKPTKKKVKKHGLPMKLVDVEHPFDKKKVIFYFTAEDRVDFRELVRDLAHDIYGASPVRGNGARELPNALADRHIESLIGSQS